MQLKPFIPTFLACFVAAVVTAPVHAGMFLIFVVPMVCVWALVNAYLAWRDPATRKHRAIRACIWAATLAALFATHWHYKSAARQAGDRAADAIATYKAAHGSYPPSLEAAGVARDPRWRVAYVVGKNGPALFYPSTFVPFDTYWYNFTRGTWAYQPD